MRRLASAVPALLALAFLAGCGTKFELPTERPRVIGVPSDQSYQMINTWTDMANVQDILITQGSGSQMFILFNQGGPINPTGPKTTRGNVGLYPLSRPTPIVGEFFQPPTSLWNPIAIASAQNKLFVLDQGDTCMAHYDVARGTCSANETPFAPNFIKDITACWRVREYKLSGGDTLSTFTDTTFAQVYGIAAGEDGYVYVSGQAIVLDTLDSDPHIRTRMFASRVYRYGRGPRPDGQDINMPGCNWHRDTTWVVLDGSGNSSVFDPAGIYYSRYGNRALYVTDRGNGKIKSVSSTVTNLGLTQADGSTTGSNFLHPEDVTADLNGFFYVVDRGNRRVLRYDGNTGEFIQRVDIEVNSQGEELRDPVSVAVNDSLAYVADRGLGKVIRYKRRP